MKNKNILRILRTFFAVAMLLLLTFFILDIFNLLPACVAWLTKIQFVPALLSLNWLILIILLLTTFLFGRIYCSIICPLGIFQDVIIRISNLLISKRKRKKRFHFIKNPRIFRLILAFLFFVSIVCGFASLSAFIEPYSIYSRISVHLWKPILLTINNLLAIWTEKTGSYYFIHENIELLGGWLPFFISVVSLLIIIVLAAIKGRLYCNSFCPVGTLLGCISKHSIFKIKINTSACTSCKRCEHICKSSCINIDKKQIDYTRCVACFDCLGNCPQHGLKFNFSYKKTQQVDIQEDREVVNSSRRQFLLASGISVVGMAKLMANTRKERVLTILGNAIPYKFSPAMPAGAVSYENLHSHCTACHLCISKCPQKVLCPAVYEYGFEGFMQPVLDFEKGFCRYNCTQCSNICPTKAIQPLTVEKKHITQVGIAIFNRFYCNVFTKGVHCGLCAENCPTGAITMQNMDNSQQYPLINTHLCIGCGACAYFCPAQPEKALKINGLQEHKSLTINI
ncbi:MAG: 4Fe-4S binding protein [Bacteroidales bacterium]|jgi:polyferredoxin|nr:4Fe-4S binding protein [Bacteroidales bacterium]